MNRNSHPFSPKSFAIPFHQNHSLFQESLMMGNSTPQVHMHYKKSNSHHSPPLHLSVPSFCNGQLNNKTMQKTKKDPKKKIPNQLSYLIDCKNLSIALLDFLKLPQEVPIINKRT
jgi:hypothetical protein